MVANLDKLLEPGERVMYRDPRGWPPLRLYLDLALYLGAAFCVAVLLMSLADIQIGARPALGFLALALFWWARKVALYYAPKAYITDRRLLATAGWRQPWVTTVPLDEVGCADCPPWGAAGGVAVTNPNGLVLWIHHLRRPKALAQALRQAAQAKAPDQ